MSQIVEASHDAFKKSGSLVIPHASTFPFSSLYRVGSSFKKKIRSLRCVRTDGEFVRARIPSTIEETRSLRLPVL